MFYPLQLYITLSTLSTVSYQLRGALIWGHDDIVRGILPIWGGWDRSDFKRDTKKETRWIKTNNLAPRRDSTRLAHWPTLTSTVAFMSVVWFAVP